MEMACSIRHRTWRTHFPKVLLLSHYYRAAPLPPLCMFLSKAKTQAMTNEMSRKGRGDKMIVIKKQPVIFTEPRGSTTRHFEATSEHNVRARNATPFTTLWADAPTSLDCTVPTWKRLHQFHLNAFLTVALLGRPVCRTT